MAYVSSQFPRNSGNISPIMIHSPYTFHSHDLFLANRKTGGLQHTSHEFLEEYSLDQPYSTGNSSSGSLTPLTGYSPSIVPANNQAIRGDKTPEVRQFRSKSATIISPDLGVSNPPALSNYSVPASQADLRPRNPTIQNQLQQNLGNRLVISTPSATRGAHSTLMCKLCCVACSNEEQLKRHTEGKLHKKKLQDREYRTVEISELPQQCTATHVHDLFRGFQLDYVTTDNGPISFLPNSSGTTECWVVMETMEECQRCISSLYQCGRILGQAISLRRARSELVCEICQLKINSEAQMTQHLQGKMHAQKLKNSPNNCTIEVRGLPPGVTLPELLQHFSPFGVTKEKVVLDTVWSEANVPEVMCLLSVKSTQMALQLIQEKHGSLIGGVRISLRFLYGTE
jgi:hypothetical protein